MDPFSPLFAVSVWNIKQTKHNLEKQSFFWKIFWVIRAIKQVLNLSFTVNNALIPLLSFFQFIFLSISLLLCFPPSFHSSSNLTLAPSLFTFLCTSLSISISFFYLFHTSNITIFIFQSFYLSLSLSRVSVHDTHRVGIFMHCLEGKISLAWKGFMTC